MVENPYLTEVMEKIGPADDYGFGIPRGFKTYHLNGRDFREYRRDYVIKYAWAIPTDEALEKISKFTNAICEIGAGTGYWAHLLSQYGVNVAAYDIAVPGIHANDYKHTKLWYPVQHGDVLSINKHQDRALMLCWPPYADSMSDATLQLYSGKKVIYIGEGQGGCTGSDKFHELLDKEWNQVDYIVLPQWDGIHDDVTLWERK